MLRITILSAVVTAAVSVGLIAAATTAWAASDPKEWKIVSRAEPNIEPSKRVAKIQAIRPMRKPVSSKDSILYDILSDQIGEMRRKSALPAVMCLAESTGDGGAETISHTLLARLEADNAQVEDSLFTLKHATECRSTGKRLVDRETHDRAMMIVAGPMETEMQGLMSGCGDYVGGFVRATDDSDFDFYTVNGGDVARKLGCELAQ